MAEARRILAVQVNMRMTAPDDSRDLAELYTDIRNGLIRGLGKPGQSDSKLCGLGEYTIEVIGREVPEQGDDKRTRTVLRDSYKSNLSPVAKKCGYKLKDIK